MDPLLPRVLRAAALTAFIGGLLALLLNPPSLSGAEDLMTLAAGAVALVLVTAWITVRLMGTDAAGEREFERIIQRSEALAREPDHGREATRFELLVADAIDRLPDEFQRALGSTPIVVSQLGQEHRAYGHYYGDTIARGNYEHRIVLYQDTLERDFGYDDELLRSQVERTLRHEVAHHLGWDERGVRGLGL